jgi:hypothetical protein
LSHTSNERLQDPIASLRRQIRNSWERLTNGRQNPSQADT